MMTHPGSSRWSAWSRANLATALAVAALLAALTPASPGQSTSPAAPSSLPPSALVSGSQESAALPAILRALGDPDYSADAARRLAATCTAADIPALFQALADPNLSDSAHAALSGAIPELYKRLRDARKAADLAATQDFNTRNGAALYLQSKFTNPAWDKLVLHAYAVIPTPAPDDHFSDFKAAIDAGCTDPVIIYYYLSRGINRPELGGVLAVTKRMRLNALALDKTDYPATRKLFAWLRYCMAGASLFKDPKSPINQEQVQVDFKRCVALFPAFVKDRPDPDSLHGAMDMLNTITDRFTAYNDMLNSHRYRGWLPQVERAAPLDPVTWYYAAQEQIDLAWYARGAGTADTVDANGWKGFRQHIDLAEAYARKSFLLDPLAPSGPTLMITVCTAQNYDRPTMESWFARAFFANPDNYDACSRKLNYLFPKWLGSVEEALDFGRKCVELGNAGNSLPLILVAAHEDLAQDSGAPAAYYLQPGVYDDLKDAYLKMLDDPAVLGKSGVAIYHARLLHAAATCQHWDDFLALAKQYKGTIDVKEFGGQALFNYNLKRAREAVAKNPA